MDDSPGALLDVLVSALNAYERAGHPARVLRGAVVAHEGVVTQAGSGRWARAMFTTYGDLLTPDVDGDQD